MNQIRTPFTLGAGIPQLMIPKAEAVYPVLPANEMNEDTELLRQ